MSASIRELVRAGARLAAGLANDSGNQMNGQGSRPVELTDFYAYLPAHTYIFTPTREPWPGASVNASLPPMVTGRTTEDGEEVFISAAAWLDQHRPVQQMSWAPGEPPVIRDRLIADGGWLDRPGHACFNLYLPPRPLLGDASQAGRWRDHIRRIYPADADHIERWLAHRVQRPGEKINHALVFGGAQGIGKDTLIEPVKHAVGPWNVSEVGPSQVLGRFTGFYKSVILRVSEARDLGAFDRFALYDHMKTLIAAPPEVLRCDEKNLREHAVPNVCGVVITTNHQSDGIFLPSDDRRHYVAWSDCTREDFPADYWRVLYGWYATGGTGHVGAYLAALDLSDFDPKKPPAKTAAFYAIVDSNRAPEDAELADALDALATGDPPARPDAVTLGAVADRATGDFANWLRDRKNARQIPHRMEAAGYAPVRNDSAKDGRWKIGTRRVAVYARADLSLRDRLEAASHLDAEGVSYAPGT